jgi:hypothetical protein
MPCCYIGQKNLVLLVFSCAVVGAKNSSGRMILPFLVCSCWSEKQQWKDDFTVLGLQLLERKTAVEG